MDGQTLMAVRSSLSLEMLSSLVITCFVEQEWEFQFLHSNKAVTQGDPLEMISYGIGILPLITNLKQEIPEVTQPWYADDAGALGAFTRIGTNFNLITRQGLGCRYYPEPSKSVLIVHLDNIEAVKDFGEHHRFKFCKGANYLGGYIGADESKSDWLRECTLTWEKT